MSEDLNKYVPKRAFKAVEKLNLALKELAALTDDENPELLDLSTGSESFYNIIGDVRIENGRLKWMQEDHDWFSKGPHEEDWNLIRQDDETGEIWFDDLDFKDQISGLNSGIKKATKYFKEYNPDWDDDENKRERFFQSDED